jgi:cysteine desulfurase
MIYLDANASSRLRPSVCEFLRSAPQFYNSSSVHSEGRKARGALREARERLLELTNAQNAELVFTSSGTEACNLMIFGFLGSVVENTHIVSSSIEHPAIKEALKSLSKAKVIEIRPEHSGQLEVDSIVNAVDKNTALVNIMLVNNETGVVQPLEKIIIALRANGYQGLIVSDATQALGKIKLNINYLFEIGLDAVAISGHKIGATAGIGAMIYNANSKYCRIFHPQIFGGPQEKGFRAGTENLIGAICFGLAAAELISKLEAESAQKAELLEYFYLLLSSKVTGLKRYAQQADTVGNTLLLGFKDCLGGDLVAALDIEGVAISTGAACASGKQGVSDTVKALEPDASRAKEVVRISLDWNTSRKDLELAADIIEVCVKRMRDA